MDYFSKKSKVCVHLKKESQGKRARGWVNDETVNDETVKHARGKTGFCAHKLGIKLLSH